MAEQQEVLCPTDTRYVRMYTQLVHDEKIVTDLQFWKMYILNKECVCERCICTRKTDEVNRFREVERMRRTQKMGDAEEEEEEEAEEEAEEEKENKEEREEREREERVEREEREREERERELTRELDMFPSNCETIEAMKRRYRRFTLETHPDKGGFPALFMILQTKYDKVRNLSPSEYQRYISGEVDVGGERERVARFEKIRRDRNDEKAAREKDEREEREREEREREEREKEEKAKANAKPICWYGQGCYRTNLKHISDFYHPPPKS